MENIPSHVFIIFILTTIVSCYLFYTAANRSAPVLLILATWLMIQGVVGYTGFYADTKAIPPRFVLLVLPPFITIAFVFATRSGRRFIDGLDEKQLTILHVLRIPVELVLYWLFVYKTVPELMTFEGRNFDVFSGISAPFIWYFGYIRKSISSNLMLLWNFICLFLLFNIVIHAFLSAPFAFQQFAFDQPNIGVLYFPYVWLPCCIVPLVLLAHLVCIRKLMRR